MALRNRSYISGNTVLKPKVQTEPGRIDKDLQKLEKSRRDFNRRNAIRANRVKRGVLTTIAIIGILSFITIFRSAMVYSLQMDYVSLQNETRQVQKQNEALKAELLKASAIDGIVTGSESLALVSEDTSKALVVDLSHENFLTEETVTPEPGFLEKIMAFLDPRA
jgi:cell division protein FtsL